MFIKEIKSYIILNTFFVHRMGQRLVDYIIKVGFRNCGCAKWLHQIAENFLDLKRKIDIIFLFLSSKTNCNFLDRIVKVNIMYDVYHYILALYLGVLQVTTTNMIST